MTKLYDVCIIGGGASGLVAANRVHRDLRVCLLEKNKIPGKKLMATGGGRCNITNAGCKNKDMTLDFFNGLGLEMYCDEEGRFFPYSNSASDVVKILTKDIDKNRICTEFHVEKVSQDQGGFIIISANEEIYARSLVLATGGKAAPFMGTTGEGYRFAKALGHTITKVYPILTPVECGDFKDIKGVRARGRVSLYRGDDLLGSEKGEIQFTQDGVSGICVFNLTPFIKIHDGEKLKDALKEYSLVVDLAPDFREEEIAARKSSFGIVSQKLAKRVDVEHLKHWRLPILGIKGWKEAQCTAGGVPLGEINCHTMESRIRENLYLTGELIDYQGPCGGFNLQNAWETGIKAAMAINKKNEI